MTQICRIIIALSLPLLLCGQAYAEHSGPYVGALLGGSALMDSESSDSKGSFGIKYKPSLLGGAVVGWDFEPGNAIGEGRIELEYTHRSNTVDKVKYKESSLKGSGEVVADSLLMNFIGVYHDSSAFAPYAGLGIGAAKIEASGLKVLGQQLGRGWAVVFAYQVAAGVDIALTERLTLDVGYRLFSSTRPKFTETDGSKFQMDYLSHNAIVGLRVGF